MAKEFSANTPLSNELAEHEASDSTSTGFKAAMNRWLSAVICARQRSAMDQISRFDPDLARQIRDVRDSHPPAE